MPVPQHDIREDALGKCARHDERFIGTDLHNPDFMKLAEAYGVTGLRCDPASLGQTLRKALSVKAPVLLEVEVPIMMPPFQIV